MITFIVLCVLMVAIALAFILPPLLQRDAKPSDKDETGRKEANLAVYRDQLSELDRDMEHGLIDREQHDQDREEIERRLLEEISAKDQGMSKQSTQPVDGRIFVYAFPICLPLIATAIYLLVGNPSALTDSPIPNRPAATSSEGPAMPPGAGQRSQQDIEANVAALAKRLEENPKDLQGWIMLARSYMSFEKYSEASAAYAKATALKPNNADLLADYAFALAMANGQQFQGQPIEVINKALKLDPQNAKALELAGNAAFQAKDYKNAVDNWMRVLAKVPAGSEVAKELSGRIEEAKRLSGGIR